MRYKITAVDSWKARSIRRMRISVRHSDRRSLSAFKVGPPVFSKCESLEGVRQSVVDRPPPSLPSTPFSSSFDRIEKRGATFNFYLAVSKSSGSTAAGRLPLACGLHHDTAASRYLRPPVSVGSPSFRVTKYVNKKTCTFKKSVRFLFHGFTAMALAAATSSKLMPSSTPNSPLPPSCPAPPAPPPLPS